MCIVNQNFSKLNFDLDIQVPTFQCVILHLLNHTRKIDIRFTQKFALMKIAILGGTPLSKTLGKKYIEAGINVVFGVSPEFDVEEPEWKSLNKFYHRLAPYESAIIQGEFILLCNENGDLPEIWVALKNSDTEGKIIIDCTNGAFDTKTGFSNTSLIQKAAPKAKIFRGFNNLGINYVEIRRSEQKAEAYFCGEEVPQKLRVKRLIEIIGMVAKDAGLNYSHNQLEDFRKSFSDRVFPLNTLNNNPSNFLTA